MKKIVVISAFLFALSSQPAFAYYSGMNASVVVGQQDFFGNTFNQGGGGSGSTLRNPGQVVAVNNKLIVADSDNNRVLIWNQIPSSNNTPADLVLGQPSFTTVDEDHGGISASSLDRPFGVWSDGTRLIVTESDNNRVLIWNQFPTTNQQAADVVVGQPNMTSSGSSVTAATLNQPTGVTYDASIGKLAIFDATNNRVLIYNSLPTTNGAAANAVIGQVDFTHNTANQGGSVGANTLSLAFTSGVSSYNGKLFIGDRVNNRVLIFNTFPSTNNASADVVIGQSTFTTNSANQGGSIGPNGLQLAGGAFADEKGRLLVLDRTNARLLIYNQIPSSNNVSADVVIGQPNFTSGTPGTSASLLKANPFGVTAFQNKLIISDSGNHRLLIFNDDTLPPALSISSSPEGRGGDVLRMTGNANTSDPYVIKNVEYSVNGNGFAGATASDGSFTSKSEDYYFDFNPKNNQPKDSAGNLIDGYTLRVRSVNNNADIKDNLFFFSPFEVLSPTNHGYESNSMPTFTFKVNKSRALLLENISKYQIQTKRVSDTSWSTYIDSIPVDFASVKGNQENIQREIWRSQNTNNGTYETSSYTAKYTDESSRIQIQSKTNSLAGSYQWKVVAVDKSGHTQDTGIRDLTVGSTSQSTNTLPIALLSITGISNKNVQSLASLSLTTSSLTPTFYGIAWGGSQITLRMANDAEIKTYTTTANMSSRFGINIPKGDLMRGKTYTVTVSSSLGEKYGEVYPFLVKIL